jgi:dimethylhistidine N-methyltransferase
MIPNRSAAIGTAVDATGGADLFLADVLDGLSRPHKELPCKYFYDERGSALFDQICVLDEYYLTRTELALLQRHAPEMARAIGEDCTLIELGSGSSIKTRLLLAELRRPRAYLPVDISGEHLERSAWVLARHFPDLWIRPVAADFTKELPILEDHEREGRPVVYFPGSTIGNFRPRDAVRLLRAIAQRVGAGGGLLIGFDIESDQSVLIPAYNDRKGVTAEFNLNLLARINRELGADFDLDGFFHKAIYVPGKERVEMHLISRSTQGVQVGDARFEFQEGESILTEYSHKYSQATICRLMSESGFALTGQWMNRRQSFTIQYLTVV